MLLLMVLLLQAHPCDLSPAAVRVSGDLVISVLFCVKPSEGVTHVDVTLDGQAPNSAELATDALPQTGPNVEGYVQYKASLGQLAPGTHTITLTALNLKAPAGEPQISVPSDLYTFTVRPVRPSRPKATSVVE